MPTISIAIYFFTCPVKPATQSAEAVRITQSKIHRPLKIGDVFFQVFRILMNQGESIYFQTAITSYLTTYHTI